VKDSNKVALITGITGQDGSYLTELLLGKGYTVHGIVRRTSNLLRSRIEHLRRDQKLYGRRFFLHYGDLYDSSTLSRIVAEVLGNIESQRDWGRAQDYVQAMWLMLQYHTADDYVVATGESHSVRDFVEAAFALVGLPWQKYVKHDRTFDRPTEPARLVGCSDKIRKKLGWKPAETFRELVREMVEAELAAIGRMQNENAD
jgi:GDP-D-mannose dehydratase